MPSSPYELSSLFAAIVIGVFLLLAIWSIIEWPRKLRAEANYEAALSKERATRAQLNGWTYLPSPGDDIKFRLKSAESADIQWQIWFDLSAASSSSSPKLTFLAESHSSMTLAFHIGDAVNYEMMQAGIGRKLLGGARLLLDKLNGGQLGELVEFYDRAKTRKSGSWIVAAMEPALLASPTIDDCIAALDRWPKDAKGRAPDSKSIEIWQGRAGLKIEIQGEYSAMSSCEHLQKIGCALCRVLA